MDMLHKVKGWLHELTEVGLMLVALAVVFGILFGPTMPFLGSGVVENLITLIKSLGEQGLVGLIALGVILYLFNKRHVHV